MNARFGSRGRRIALVTTTVFAIAGGIAFASIPDEGTGVYHACLAKNGAIRLFDPTSDSCGTNETAITFNKEGVPGAPGTNGVSPTVTPLAVGNANCPAGGAAITDAAGSTAYVCSGADFAGTFTSPNGHYSLAVTDTGITLIGPAASVAVSGAGVAVDVNQPSSSVTVTSAGLLELESVTGTSLESDRNLTLRAGAGASLESGQNLALKAGTGASLEGTTSLALKAGTDATLESGQNLALKAGSSATLEAAASLGLKGGATATLQAGGVTDVKGGLVRLNGPGCQPAARLGDVVSGAVPPTGGAFIAPIVSGSPTVCIG